MNKVKLKNYLSNVFVEEYRFLYMKLADARKYKPIDTDYGKFAVIHLYDENMKSVYTYDVFTIIGRVKIDFDYKKKMYRIFGYVGNIYLDRCVGRIIGDLKE